MPALTSISLAAQSCHYISAVESSTVVMTRLCVQRPAFDPYAYCLSSRLAAQASCVAKTLSLDIIYMQTVQPNFLIPAMFLGAIDFYHFIPF